MASDAGLASKLSGLNPFKKSHHAHVDDEDQGGEIDQNTVAGGGHGAHADPVDVTKHQLRVSRALRAFLVDRSVISESEAGLESDENTDAVRRVLESPHAIVPSELTDRSHPLPEYFVSSSHNTYLKAHQLYGSSAADAYEIALKTGSRCVEIDAWDSDDKEEPKVTHGFTLVSNIPFRTVCETIRDFIDWETQEVSSRSSNNQGTAILLSLENHCDAYGQKRLAEIMLEVFGHRLISAPLREDRLDDHVTLQELNSKVVVIVEHHIPEETEGGESSESSSSSDDSSDEDEKSEEAARKEYDEKKKAAPTSVIIPELAALGVYAQSVKPGNNSWFDPGVLTNGPHHHLINISESGLTTHLPTNNPKVAAHNSRHLMRVFPKGTRISSRNLNPVPFWGIGAQICALNWQRFDATMQINEALFSGSDGYILKPAALREGGDGKLSTGRKMRLRLQVAGATDIPLFGDHTAESIRPYLTCSLVHPDDLSKVASGRKKKTSVYKQHKNLSPLLGDEKPPATDPVWDEALEWDYEANELAFLRLLIKSEESFATNPKFAVAAVRLSYVVPEWRFIRMFDLKGRETGCSLLVKFEITEL